MGQLYAYRGILPTIAASAAVFDTAEITGDVVVGERTIIGAGVKIIGDSHGPVRIGNDVQILENTVLHLLPDNELVIDDGAIVGPGAMVHGCHIGAGSVIEPGAIVCDGSFVGAGCVVRAGAVVKQRSRFADGTEIDGFPAVAIGRIEPPEKPAWALRPRRAPHTSARKTITMTSRHHIAHAVATTGSDVPAYRVELRARFAPTRRRRARGAGWCATPARPRSRCSSAGSSPAPRSRCACTPSARAGLWSRSRSTPATTSTTTAAASIDRTITLPADLSDEQRDRLAEIAERTPVTLAVRAGTPIATTVIIARTD